MMNRTLVQWLLSLWGVFLAPSTLAGTTSFVSDEGSFLRACVAGNGPHAKTKVQALVAQHLADKKQQTIFALDSMNAAGMRSDIGVVSAAYVEKLEFQYFDLVKNKQVFICVEILK